MPKHLRLTQKHIAELAGVSQATVSLVLNGGAETVGRIPEQTRERVIRVIRETGYVADPVAQRMAQGRNRILGVFTYEPAFPSGQSDFFTPFLHGIEEAAEAAGYDLLLLTGGARGKPKKIFAEDSRMRIADGCLVLGRDFDRAELQRLTTGDYPFVAIGRRDDAGGPVPYVGGDYRAATAALMRRAAALGHRRFAFVGPAEGPESTKDRWQGFIDSMAEGCVLVLHVDQVGQDAAQTLDAIAAQGATVVVVAELVDAVRLEVEVQRRHLVIPGDLSIIVLGRHYPAEPTGRQFATYLIPREEMGRQATRMLIRRIEGSGDIEQVLVPCEPLAGDTLGHPIKTGTT